MTEQTHSWIGHSWPDRPANVQPGVVSAACSERPSRHGATRIVYDSWVLDYSRSDCGLVRVGSGRWQRRPAMIAHLYRPGTVFWENNTGAPDLIRESWVLFTGGDSADLDRFAPLDIGFARIVDPAGQLQSQLHDLATTGQTLGDDGFWRAQSLLALIVETLHSAARQDNGTWLLAPAGSHEDEDAQFVRRANKYFRMHLGEKITLQSAARHLHLSTSAFSHRYARQVGQSPMAMLLEMRIEAAKSLLLRGLKMESIARQVGFFDAFHFSRTFKKRCGISPSVFRKDMTNSGSL